MANNTSGKQEELIKHVLPALKLKKSIMEQNGYNFLSEIDIWNNLKNNKWNKEKGLMLCDMVDDILNAPDNLILGRNVEKNSFESIDLPKLKAEEVGVIKSES